MNSRTRPGLGLWAPASRRINLLSWVHSGFSVHVGGVLDPEDPSRLERQARYAVRVPMPMDCVELVEGGKVRVLTPPDPRTGQTEMLMDPLLCPRCKVEMKVVSVIVEPQVIDRILGSLRNGGGRDPFGERSPPGEGKVRAAG